MPRTIAAPAAIRPQPGSGGGSLRARHSRATSARASSASGAPSSKNRRITKLPARRKASEVRPTVSVARVRNAAGRAARCAIRTGGDERRPLLQQQVEPGRRELRPELRVQGRVAGGRGLERDHEVGDHEQPEVLRHVGMDEHPQQPAARRGGDRLPGEPALAFFPADDQAADRPEDRQRDRDPGCRVRQGEEGADREQRLPPPLHQQGRHQYREADQPDVRPAHLHPLGEQGAEPAEREHEPPGARRAHDPQGRRERADQEDLAEQDPQHPGRPQRQAGEGQEQDVEQGLAVGEMVMGDRERRPAERLHAQARGEHLAGEPEVVVLVVRPGLGVLQPLPEEEQDHRQAGEDEPEARRNPPRRLDRGGGRRLLGLLSAPGLLGAGETDLREGGGVEHGGKSNPTSPSTRLQ